MRAGVQRGALVGAWLFFASVGGARSVPTAPPAGRVECVREPGGDWGTRDGDGRVSSSGECHLPYERELREVFWPQGAAQASRLRQLTETHFDAAIVSEPECTMDLARFGCHVDRLWVKPTHPLNLLNVHSDACAEQAIRQIRDAMADVHLVACLQARAIHKIRLTVMMMDSDLLDRARREGVDQPALEAGELQLRALAVWSGSGSVRCPFVCREALRHGLCP
jgi:hypothetical protein